MTIIFNSLGHFTFATDSEITLQFGDVESAVKLFNQFKDEAVLLLEGGPDVNPMLYGKSTDYCGRLWKERDEWYSGLVNVALRLEIPIIGICAGHQFMAVHIGKVPLIRDLQAELGITMASHAGNHQVMLFNELEECYLERIMLTNTYHHQAVAEVPRNANLIAKSLDGIIEGLYYPNDRAISVQWHPEAYNGKAPDMVLLENMLTIVKG